MLALGPRSGYAFSDGCVSTPRTLPETVAAQSNLYDHLPPVLLPKPRIISTDNQPEAGG